MTAESKQRLSLSLHWLAALMSFGVAVSLAVCLQRTHASKHISVFQLSNLVGGTAWSLLHGQGLSICTESMGTLGNPICYHAARMPVASSIVALGYILFGDSFALISFFKMILLLLPVLLSMAVVWRRMPEPPVRNAVVLVLLGLPFLMLPFLADVANVQVEEGYSYSFLALSAALLLFGPTAWGFRAQKDNLGAVILFAVAVDGLYLSKSSMIAVVAVLTLAFLLQQKEWLDRAVLLVMVAVAPLGWALHQYRASGRYSLGTSLDGINLHKANVDTFLKHYPPAPNTSLDMYDPLLNRGLTFNNEWSFNDYHQKAAIAFMKHFPGATLQGDLRKLDVFFISLRHYGSSDSQGAMLVAETFGILLFRIVLWVAILGSVYGLVKPPTRAWRITGLTFLALVGACALPYIMGFAYTRHASVLIYPACLMCCWMLAIAPEDAVAAECHPQ